MLQSLQLDNYRNFDKLFLDGFRRINILSGMNNTGKTSILEAIFMAHDRYAADFSIKPLVWRGLTLFEMNARSIWHPYFHNFDFEKPIKITLSDSGYKSVVEYRISKSVNTSFILDSINKNPGAVMDSSVSEDETMNTFYFENNKKTGSSKITIGPNNQLNMHLNDMQPPRKTAVFVPASSRGNNHNDAESLGKMDIDYGLGEFVKYLQMIEPRLKSISIVPAAGQSTLYADISLKRKVPLSYMGEGISKLISILTAILSRPNGVIMIDEIENGIHYSLFPKIWEVIFDAAKKHNTQIFVTTHSNDVLRGLAKYWESVSHILPIEKQDAIFIRLDKNNEGEVKPKKYDSSTLATAIERDWDIR